MAKHAYHVMVLGLLFPCTTVYDSFGGSRSNAVGSTTFSEMHADTLATLYGFIRNGLTETDLRNDAANPAEWLLMLLDEPSLWYLSDVQFIVGDAQKKFHAHRLILSGRSPVFKNMFGYGRNGLPRPDESYFINDLQPDVFAAVLRYIYGKLFPPNPNVHLLLNLTYAGQKYVIPSLVDASIILARQSLTPSNVVWVLERANTLDQKELAASCWQVIRGKARDLLKDPEFENLSLDFLKKLMSQDQLLNVSEAYLFDRLMAWAGKRLEPATGLNDNLHGIERGAALRKIMEPLLRSFRFLSMTGPEFARGPCASGVLTREEQFEVIMSISNGDDGKNWKSQFSTSRRESAVPATSGGGATDRLF